MRLKGVIKGGILDILKENGNHGITTIEVSKRLGVERHTIAKYMRVMNADNVITCKSVGKAKLWFLNKNSLIDVIPADSESLTFVENTLIKILNKSPVGIFLVDNNLRIRFMNDFMVSNYGSAVGKFFYESILGLPNPLKVRVLRDVVHDRDVESGELSVRDKFGKVLTIKASKITDEGSDAAAVIIADYVKEKNVVSSSR